MRFAFRWVCAALLATVCSPLLMAQRLSLQAVMGSPFPDELVAARQAPVVAWTFNWRGVRNVWMAQAPAFHPVQVTHYQDDDGQAIPALALSDDGTELVYVRGNEVNAAGEEPNPQNLNTPPPEQVWAVDITPQPSAPRLLGAMGCKGEGCEYVAIAPDGSQAAWGLNNQLWVAPLRAPGVAKVVVHTQWPVEEPHWAPDSRRIAFTSDRKDHSFIGIYDPASPAVQYLLPSTSRDDLPRWSADGKTLVFIRRPGREQHVPMLPLPTRPWAIWRYDFSSGQGQQLWCSGPGLLDSLPVRTEDQTFAVAGDRILFSSEQDGWNHLYSLPLGGGAPLRLTSGKFEVGDVALSSDQRSVVYAANPGQSDLRHLFRVALTGGKPRQLTRGTTIEWSPVVSGGDHIICLGSSGRSPAMPYFVSHSKRVLMGKRLLKGFPSKRLVRPQPVVFTSGDGWTIHAQLFEPHGATPAQGWPALVYVHGGPHRQMVLGFNPMKYYHYGYAENEYLVSRGYVVLAVNYRDSTMYGRTFREPPNAGWRGASDYQDVLAAGRYLQTLKGVDPHRIGIWGGSYGGYLVALALARNSDVFAAGVDMHGVHDWRTEHTVDATAPDYQQAQQLAFQSSPEAALATWRSPVLLIQGDDDRNVAFLQMVDLAQRLRAGHIPFQQIVFPGETHDFRLWRDWIRAFRATTDFFNLTLSPQAGGQHQRH